MIIMSFLVVRCFILALLCGEAYQATYISDRKKCQPVPPFCKNLADGGGYTEQMQLPNEFRHNSLREVADAILPWKMLVGHCHAGLRLFLCAIYAPMCVNTMINFEPSEKSSTVPVCKSFCSAVRDSCEPVMRQHNHSWPEHDAFNCSKYVDDLMCLSEPVTPTVRPTPTEGSNGDICDRDDGVLQQKFSSCDFVFKAEVIRIAKARTHGFRTLIKLKQHQKRLNGKTGQRRTRKVKKTAEFPDRVLVPGENGGCRNLKERLDRDQHHLVMIAKQFSKRKTRYIVTAIVPWNKKYKRFTKKPNCAKAD
ncbi:PREDICTED: secreted frizzled-related protein 1-like [Acropora digitifera]|uniref:secreted frizzled-related protein 1-like n=1 Tax=Acropora digitifera TaxID=70779 RepID=UPI00077A0E8E|nr:PREDICTED: secreted frizzled-related protein 1-like [Acropora digitifera]